MLHTIYSVYISNKMNYVHIEKEKFDIVKKISLFTGYMIASI